MPSLQSVSHVGADWFMNYNDEWSVTEAELYWYLRSTPNGLSLAEAHRRWKPTHQSLGIRRTNALQIIGRQLRNPIVMILMGVALVSTLVGEPHQSAIVIGIIATSAFLGFIQERGAMKAVQSLLDTIGIHADAIRDNRECEVLVPDIVPGDVVVLRVGDVVPGDARVIEANQLQLDESTLTGESFPRRKFPGVMSSDTPFADRSNMVHFGTYVASGEGKALIARVGAQTEFGQIVGKVSEHHLPTSFERGVTAFGYMLSRAMFVLVLGIFLVNLILHRSVVESLLFSLALAVGLTPQMLPAIVTLSLSRGAIAMAHNNVIVKRLDAIEDIGSVDVLCTDKTGTITEGSVVLHACVDYHGDDDASVGTWGWLIARFQQGYSNPIDDAILAREDLSSDLWSYVDEVPFDFSRKRMSVLLESRDGRHLLTKGALEPLLEKCQKVNVDNHLVPLDDVYDQVIHTFEKLSSQGYRVLGVAHKFLTDTRSISISDESDLVFAGFLIFSDPVKLGVSQAISTLRDMGVKTRMITGDNRLSASYVARSIGLDPSAFATGSHVEKLSDKELISLVETTHFFVEVDPLQKARIVQAYSSAGHTVGFLGDGVNDSPALHAADVGVSVEGAVDIAKQTADLVLLNKDLSILITGIGMGRKIFANTLKYVHVTTSANFGNMMSLVAATIFLPFIPLLPMQILLLNFLSDIPGIAIANDNVEDTQIRRPQTWDIERVRSFMIVFGTVSTAFDLLTFAVLRLVFDANETLLRSGWFIESMLTELVALLLLRTSGLLWRSRPSNSLLLSSLAVGLATIALPYSPVANSLGLEGPSIAIAVVLVGITFCYVIATELLKGRFSHLIDTSSV